MDYRLPHSAQPLYFVPRRARPPLYCLLKKTDQFAWTPEAQEALDKVKELLMKAPILVPPAEREPLLLYMRPPHRWSALPWW
jgi:hypothetical protein